MSLRSIWSLKSKWKTTSTTKQGPKCKCESHYLRAGKKSVNTHRVEHKAGRHRHSVFPASTSSLVNPNTTENQTSRIQTTDIKHCDTLTSKDCLLTKTDPDALYPLDPPHHRLVSLSLLGPKPLPANSNTITSFSH